MKTTLKPCNSNDNTRSHLFPESSLTFWTNVVMSYVSVKSILIKTNQRLRELFASLFQPPQDLIVPKRGK